MTAHLHPPVSTRARQQPGQRTGEPTRQRAGQRAHFREAMAPDRPRDTTSSTGTTRRRHDATARTSRLAGDVSAGIADVELPKRSLAERRAAALSRLQVATAPRAPIKLPFLRGRADPLEPSGLWDQRRDNPPIAYYVIAVLTTVFVMLGLVMVLSASAQTRAVQDSDPFEVFNRQVVWAAIGCVGLVVACRINLVWIRRLANPLLLVATVAMLLPFAPGVGVSINGARSWVQLGPFSVQPSEIMKLGLAIFAASLLVRRQSELSDIRRSLRPLLLLALIGAGVCLVQGDLGSAIVMAAIVLVIAFIGGVPFIPLAVTGIAAGTLALGFVVSSPRRLNRFTAFLDIAAHKDSLSYQTYQGMLAIADGGFTGSGVGAGNGKLGYIPLAHSDFIFAVIADELGLIGTVAVVGGFCLLAWFGIQAALASPDRFGMLLAGGIAAWFGVQAVINMGGVVGLMPVTGLTLPFFSSGGTSLLVSMVAIGLLLNIARRGQPAADAST